MLCPGGSWKYRVDDEGIKTRQRHKETKMKERCEGGDQSVVNDEEYRNDR